MRVEVGAAQQNCNGETICGDGYAVFEDDGVVTIAVSDGLGHGPEAAKASNAFLKSIEKNRMNRTPADLLRASSSDITGTRGVAAAVIRISKNDNTLSFSGIGNIEFVSKSINTIRPICSPGIVGRSLRAVRQFDYDISPGDMFVVFSDGISSRVDFSRYFERLTTVNGETPESVARAIVKDHGKLHDDGTCVLIRLLD